MRAAAVALVLIIGAVVLLIFANTLNSWVLGGLIGGLAALLISIPISLFLFTILARRHDEELWALQEELEEIAAASIEGRQYAEVYETDAHVLSDEENFYNDPRDRRLSGARSLPAAGQSRASESAYGSYNQRPGNYPPGSKRPSQALPQARGKGIPTQQLAPDHHLQKHSVHEVNAKRSKYQTAALRAAQREAALESNDDIEVVPTHSTAPYKHVSPARSSQPLFEQSTQFKQVRPTHQLPPEQQAVNPNSPRRVGDAASDQKGRAHRNVPSGGVYFPGRAPRTDSLRSHEPQTDRLRERYPETEPVYLRSQTGQLIRNPQLGEQLRDPDIITGSLNNPLVRRAPYMYEDDPLREELAQQINGPIMRRSSRFLQNDEE